MLKNEFPPKKSQTSTFNTIGYLISKNFVGFDFSQC